MQHRIDYTSPATGGKWFRLLSKQQLPEDVNHIRTSDQDFFWQHELEQLEQIPVIVFDCPNPQFDCEFDKYKTQTIVLLQSVDEKIYQNIRNSQCVQTVFTTFPVQQQQINDKELILLEENGHLEVNQNNFIIKTYTFSENWIRAVLYLRIKMFVVQETTFTFIRGQLSIKNSKMSENYLNSLINVIKPESVTWKGITIHLNYNFDSDKLEAELDVLGERLLQNQCALAQMLCANQITWGGDSIKVEYEISLNEQEHQQIRKCNAIKVETLCGWMWEVIKTVRPASITYNNTILELSWEEACTVTMNSVCQTAIDIVKFMSVTQYVVVKHGNAVIQLNNDCAIIVSDQNLADSVEVVKALKPKIAKCQDLIVSHECEIPLLSCSKLTKPYLELFKITKYNILASDLVVNMNYFNELFQFILPDSVQFRNSTFDFVSSALTGDESDCGQLVRVIMPRVVKYQGMEAICINMMIDEQFKRKLNTVMRTALASVQPRLFNINNEDITFSYEQFENLRKQLYYVQQCTQLRFVEIQSMENFKLATLLHPNIVKLNNSVVVLQYVDNETIAVIGDLEPNTISLMLKFRPSTVFYEYRSFDLIYVNNKTIAIVCEPEDYKELLQAVNPDGVVQSISDVLWGFLHIE